MGFPEHVMLSACLKSHKSPHRLLVFLENIRLPGSFYTQVRVVMLVWGMLPITGYSWVFVTPAHIIKAVALRSPRIKKTSYTLFKPSPQSYFIFLAGRIQLQVTEILTQHLNEQ